MYDRRDNESGATQSGQRDAPRVGFGLAQPVWPRAYAVALTTLLACGIALRCSSTVLSLWIDEAWVVNSAASATLHDMFFFTGWVQTTPPGVLLLLRALHTLGGVGVDHLRWLPIACSVLTLLLFARLAAHLLSAGFVLLACAVVALSPEVLWYGAQIKQYTFDMLAMTVSLLLGLAYIRAPSALGLRLWFAGYGLAIGVSFPAAFTLPVMVVVAGLNGRGHTWHARLRDVMPLAICAALVTAGLYLTFVRPNAGLDNLGAFWAQGFLSSSGYSPAFFLRKTLAVMLEFTHLDLVTPARAVAAVIGLMIGSAALWRLPGYRRAQRAGLVALVCLPIINTLAANLLGLYPLSEFRLVSFLVPCLVLLPTAAFERITASGLAWLSPLHRRRAAFIFATAVALGAALHLTASAGLPFGVAQPQGAVFQWEGNMDMRPVVNYLRDVDTLARPVFVHAAYQQLFEVYTQQHRLQAPVLYGQSGWPCCIPGRAWRGAAFDGAEINREVARLIGQFPPGPMYFVLVTHAFQPKRDAAHFYVEALAAHHCATTWRTNFGRIALLKAQCNEDPSATHARSSDGDQPQAVPLFSR